MVREVVQKTKVYLRGIEQHHGNVGSAALPVFAFNCDPLNAVKGADFFSGSDREKILWKNAKEVLKFECLRNTLCRLRKAR